MVLEVLFISGFIIGMTATILFLMWKGGMKLKG